jgi:hypothetical protein
MTSSVSASGQSSNSSIVLNNLQPGTSYVVQVQAVGADQSGNTSDWSIGYIFVVPNL